MMRGLIITIFLMLTVAMTTAQQLLLLDRFNGNNVVNDSTITVFSSEAEIHDITQYFTMKNNTDKKLAVFLRKTINVIADSTTDYYCFGIRCWPGDDSTNIADTIPPWGEDYTFASHVTHQRRFDLPQPILPLGLSSITYTVYDKTTFPEPVEASVTVIYHHSGLGVEEAGKQGGGEAGIGMQVYPNPLCDMTSIGFYLPESGFVSLAIFDINGRIVRNLANEFYPSGTYSLTWNGDDNHGGQASPGIYVCRFIAADQSKSIRVIVQ